MFDCYRKIIRVGDSDYSRQGYYYVTIKIMKNGIKFGVVENDIVMLNDFGKIAEACWIDIPNHYPECKLHEFVIMPDHIHGIIEIEKYSINKEISKDRSKRHMNRMSCAVGSYKSAVSNKIHQLGENKFKWQRSFYERIVRSFEFDRITQYIKNNPKNEKFKM